VDLAKVLEDLHMLAKPVLYRMNGSVELSVQDGIPYLHADPTLLRQAMLHVLERALDGLREGDKILVSARRNDNRVEVEFAMAGRALPVSRDGPDGPDGLKLPRDMARRLGGDLRVLDESGRWVLSLPVEQVAHVHGEPE
jgi:hypothetical protein